jgi:hypothetical protein
MTVLHMLSELHLYTVLHMQGWRGAWGVDHMLWEYMYSTCRRTRCRR